MSAFDYVKSIQQCDVCAAHLPFSPRPILQYSANAKVVIIGQAPGIKAHESQIPWNDQSGDRLRHWLQVSRVDFYDKSKFSILPMGFCYPGKGRSGDLPPRPECAPKWHTQLLNASNNKVCILIGKYAQDYYLRDKRTLTERLKHWRGYLPEFVVMPHPSPRNNIWLKKNKWFESEVLPKQQSIISPLIKET